MKTHPDADSLSRDSSARQAGVSSLEETQPSDVAPPPRKRRFTAPNLGLHRFSGLYVLALIVIVFGAWVPDTFLTIQTLSSVASQQAVVAILGLALLVPLAAGVFDLSVGAMLGLGVVLVCKFQSIGMGFVVAIALTVAIGALVGAVNAFVIVFLRVNSFIATLGTSSVLGAMVYWVSGNQQIVTGISRRFRPTGAREAVGRSVACDLPCDSCELAPVLDGVPPPGSPVLCDGWERSSGPN